MSQEKTPLFPKTPESRLLGENLATVKERGSRRERHTIPAPGSRHFSRTIPKFTEFRSSGLLTQKHIFVLLQTILKLL